MVVSEGYVETVHETRHYTIGEVLLAPAAEDV